MYDKDEIIQGGICMFKRIISFILVTILLLTVFSTGAVSAEETAENEWVAAADRIKQLSPVGAENTDTVQPDEAAKLPSALDLRDYHGMNYVTPVKLQSPFGTCWAFAIAAAAEISYLYANDLGVPAGTANENVDFSEKHIAWYTFHGLTDDDVTVGRVRSSQVGEGFDVSTAEQNNRNAVYDVGGTSILGFNLFASGFGPVDERVAVNGAYPFSYCGKERTRSSYGAGYAASDDWTLPVNAEHRAAPSCAFLRNSAILPSPASMDEYGQYRFDQAGVDAIKAELAKGHGVAAGICVSSGMNTEHWAGYNATAARANHDVTIVGYDDHYSKDNFTRYTAKGKVIKNSTPPADGAFIVKNSNGALTDEDRAAAVTDENGRVTYPNPNAAAWGIDDSGYFYLSYYDRSIETPCSFDFDSAASVSYTERNYDQYDLMMTDSIDCNEYDTEAKTANVFEAEEDEYLFRISYMTNMPDMTVSYAIYQGVENGAPDSGTLLEQGQNTHAYNGVHTVDLQHEYYLRKGERYSVVLTMEYEDEGETAYLEILPIFLNPIPRIRNNAVVNAGESYLYADGEWSDLESIRDDFIDERYETYVAMLGSEEKVNAMIQGGRDGIAVDNYPIKAILVPASVHDTAGILGDVNLDHDVDITDATWIQRCDAKMLSLSAAALPLADVDRDGDVCIIDATWIQRFLNGLAAPKDIGEIA